MTTGYAAAGSVLGGPSQVVVKITMRDTGDMAGQGKRSAADMIRSLAVIGIAVVFMFVYSVQQQPRWEVPAVDVAATVEAARKNVDFPVLALEPTPAGWRANAAYFDPIAGEDRWIFHIGYVSPSEAYYGVDATNQSDIDAFVSGYVAGTATGESKTIAGLTFEGFLNQKQQMWVHKSAGADPFAIVVTGSGNVSEFATFLAGLRAG